MKIYLKIMGWISISIGLFVVFLLLSKTEKVTLSIVFIIIGSVSGGIFTLAFAEVLERLQQIQKNTTGAGDDKFKIQTKIE